MAASVSKTLWVMLLGCMIAKVTSQDPCTDYKTLQHIKRVVSYKSTPTENEECDRYLPNGDNWYRLVGNSASDLIDYCPDIGQCGTLFPIWLNGTIPSTSEKIVTRTACMRGFLDEACCETPINIRLINCGAYRVAYLHSLQACPGKYCFAPFVDLGSSAKASVEPFVNSSDGSRPHDLRLYFHCNRTSDGSSSSYFFDVNWYIDGKLVKTISNVPHSRYDTDTALGEDASWQLPMKVKCSYRARFSRGGVPSPPVMSDEFFAGMKVSPEGVIQVNEGSTGNIYFQSTIPVPCITHFNGYLRDWCGINFENAVNETHGGCTLTTPSNALIKLSNDCGFSFNGKNWKSRQSMAITAISDSRTGNPTNPALIRLSTSSVVRFFPLWQNYKLPEIKVITRDRNRATMTKQCLSYTDVMIIPFNRRYYQTNHAGRYLLYNHTEKPIEVMTLTQNISLSKTVNCAVSVKAGNDVYIIYICQNKNFVKRYGCGTDSNLEVYVNQQSKNTKIILPTGTKVQIQYHLLSGVYTLRIYIYPSPDDVGKVTGLCGDLDGVNSDDSATLRSRFRLGGLMDSVAFVRAVSGSFPVNHQICLCPENHTGFTNIVVCSWRTSVSCSRMKWNEKPCQNRQKRDAHLDEEDWISEDFIYEENRPEERRLARSTWTLTAARDKCLNVFEQYASFNKCRELSGLDVSDVLDVCAADVVSIGETGWIPQALEVIKSQCINILDVDVDLWIRTVPGEPSLGEVIFTEAKCPSECNNNGRCVKGVCQCNPNFVEEDCSVNLQLPPTVERLTRNGICDLSNPNTSCSATHVFGNNFYESDRLTCRVQEFMIDNTGVKVDSTSTTQQAVFETFRQIMCIFPDTKTFRTPHDGIGVHGYYVEVSNNGVIYSTSLTFMASDPRCHQCDLNSMTCSRKADSCLIEGKCYTSGEAKPTEPHMKCTPAVSGFNWTQDTTAGFSIRLVGGVNDSSGRVEVRNSTAYSWGTVCSNGWDYRDATVVCRMLGYDRGIPYRYAHFGRGTGEIVLDNVACSGSESSLQDCGNRGWGTHYCKHYQDVGVACFTGWQVRLAGGNRFTSGRVEMRNSTAYSWGTVCDDSWDYRDATVVCRMFGYEGGRPYNSAHFGQGSGEIVLDNVACSGLEYSLQDCPHQGWGSHNCGHQEDAGVECFNDPRWQLRLAYGNSSSGRVEVRKSSVWGTICDNNWNDNDATVVCRTLGYNRGHAFSHAHFGVGTGKSALDDVACLGSEPSLAYCYNQGWDYHYCGRNEYPGVVCSDGWQVRLVGGNSSSSGRVEVRNSTAYSWGTVCDDSWDYRDATVVCRRLGYTRGIPYNSAHFGQGSGEIVLDDVACSGSESSLQDCGNQRSHHWGSHNCKHSEDAGVACFTDQDWLVRLVGGNSSSGRVEVRNSTTYSWGTVCDNYWDNSDATVVCRMLGYYGGQAHRSTHFGAGTGEIVLDDVACSGSEPSLQYCRNRGWGSHNCGHHEDAGVACFNDFSVQLVGGTSSSGRVEVRENESSAWGTVCDTYWDYRDATVTCHKLGYNWGEAHSDAYFGTGSGPIYIDKTSCVGSEGSLTGCRRSQWGVHNCTHSQDAGVSCHNVSVRLVNGTSTSGRVELRWNDTSAWGTVCDNGWDSNDAKVVCRMLGLTGGRDYQMAYFGEGTGDIYLNYVGCGGNELSLSACGHWEWGRHNCGHHEDAGVVCDDPSEI